MVSFKKIKFREGNCLITNFIQPGDTIKYIPDPSYECSPTIAKIVKIGGPYFKYSHPITDFNDIDCPEHYQIKCVDILPKHNKGRNSYFTVICQDGNLKEFVERYLDKEHHYLSTEHSAEFKIIKRAKALQMAMF
jgi:hypothetical protein